MKYLIASIVLVSLIIWWFYFSSNTNSVIGIEAEAENETNTDESTSNELMSISELPLLQRIDYEVWAIKIRLNNEQSNLVQGMALQNEISFDDQLAIDYLSEYNNKPQEL